MANQALAKAIARKQAELKKSKPQPSTKESKKNGKKAAKKEPRKSSVERIKDAKGHEVTGRDNSFICPECKKSITGPWSFKTHLVKQHKYSRKEAGLRPE